DEHHQRTLIEDGIVQLEALSVTVPGPAHREKLRVAPRHSKSHHVAGRAPRTGKARHGSPQVGIGRPIDRPQRPFDTREWPDPATPQRLAAAIAVADLELTVDEEDAEWQVLDEVVEVAGPRCQPG